MDFFAAETVPFAIALCVTAGIAVIEAIGMFTGFSASHAIDNTIPDLHVEAPHAEVDLEAPDVADAGHMHVDVDVHHADATHLGPLSQLLAWFSFGRVPALVVLILFAASFGLSGFLIQGAAARTLGFPLSPALASIPALVAAAYATRWSGRLLGRIIPKEETDAVSSKVFIGRIATVIRGEARQGKPAEAKLRDGYGQTHYLLVEPDEAAEVFGEGSEVLLIRQHGGTYRAVTKLKPKQ